MTEANAGTGGALAGAPGRTDVARTAPRASAWHVSPVVDVAAYALSWLWPLAPLLLVASSAPADFAVTYMVILVASDVHRHFGFPYVYLDGQVFWQHPARFVIFPAAMTVLAVASPTLVRSALTASVPMALAWTLGAVVLFQAMSLDRPGTALRGGWAERSMVPALTVGLGGAALWPSAEGLAWLLAAAWAVVRMDREAAAARDTPATRPPWTTVVACGAALTGLATWALVPTSAAPTLSAATLVNLAGVGAGVWNVWHVYMQKYGVLRMYAAKAGVSAAVPGWTDRLLVFAWLPSYVFVLAPSYTAEVGEHFRRGANVLLPFIGAVTSARWALAPLCFGAVALSAANWLWREWRATGLTVPARLWMAAGTFALGSSFFWVHPVKAYLAFSFSHAVEYFVFVWAFQRRRYGGALPHQPVMSWFVRHFWPTLGVAFGLLGAFFLYTKYAGRFYWMSDGRPTLAGVPWTERVVYWSIFGSMIHFYFDGFLWKMRLPQVRQTV